MKLAIVTSYFNPCGYSRLRDNFYRFVEGLGGARERLWVSMLTMRDSQAEKPDSLADFKLLNFLGDRPQHMLWQKERLMNQVIPAVPAEFDCIAWVDADVLFQDSQWVENAELMLEQFAVGQLFTTCRHLGRNGNVEVIRSGIAHDCRNGLFGVKEQSSYGLAWAARRDFLGDGLLDWLITGAGDAFMADAWMGKRREVAMMSAPMARIYRPWAEKQHRITGGRVGHLAGTVDHLWHGAFENRRYRHRNRLLVSHRFDPLVDIVADGPLYRWADPESPLAQAVIEWFSARKEDG